MGIWAETRRAASNEDQERRKKHARKKDTVEAGPGDMTWQARQVHPQGFDAIEGKHLDCS